MRRGRSIALVVLVVVATACGGGGGDSGGDDTAATTAPDGTDPSPATSTTAPSDTTASTTTPATPESTTASSTPVSTVPETTVTPSTAPPTTIEPVLAVGDAVLIEDQVDLRSVDTAEFTPLADPTPVAVGDVLRTDDTGYGEIAYFDGSRTRLDVNTEFEILELVDQAGQSLARTRMGLGRTWHRVEALGETEGGFSVETLVATATVRGTAFSIDCTEDDSCGFSVMEGTIELTLLDGTTIQLVAPARLEIVDGVAGQPLPLPFDQAFGDDWLLDNADRDSQVGFTDAPRTYRDHGPNFATLHGTFTVTLTGKEKTCPGGTCIEYDGEETFFAVGVDFPGADESFDLDCSSGFPCAGTRGEATASTYDGLALTYTEHFESSACSTGGDTGLITHDIEVRLTPSMARVRGDEWRVVELRGTLTHTDVVVEGGIGCTSSFPGPTNVYVYDMVAVLA